MFVTGARPLLLLLCASLSFAVRILTWPPPNCSTQGLWCKVHTSYCMSPDDLNSQNYTPASPEELEVSVETRRDKEGNLQPLLNAKWKLKDDGSISYLKATQLRVLVFATNQNFCLRYTFRDTLPMRNLLGQKWSFSADMVVLEPGQSYNIAVMNIPRPEIDHTDYDVSMDLVVPDCQHPEMQMTQFCIEQGSMWKSNITLARAVAAAGGSTLAVSFSTDSLCEEYTVIVRCSRSQQHVQGVKRANRTTLNVTFSLDQWPRSCCLFDAEVKPHYTQCGQDCIRHRRTQDTCHAPNPKPGPVFPHALLYTLIALSLLAITIVTVNVCVFCRKSGKGVVAPAPVPPMPLEPTQTPKVLVIYSHDHYLYREIVLNLCAFLQAKCGTNVVIDLLDSTSIGMMGRLRWLEWQRQQLQNPCDKILVLCSPGVQAKWRALCGQGRVTLREDLLSPTDDILIPFLHLFLNDLHKVGMLGKYLVAYFDEISSEEDIPSVFDITVKYKLMKHFEELFFCLLDIEKYHPDRVAHIQGISGDEYFSCDSGRALKNAIEAFQIYQLENPDWFEKQCVDNEEDIMNEASVMLEHIEIPPVLQCVPEIRSGPPAFVQEVEICENNYSIHILTPELNPQQPMYSVAELPPLRNPEYSDHYQLYLDKMMTDHMYPQGPCPESACLVQPVFNSPSPRPHWPSVEEQPLTQIPDEEESLMPASFLSSHCDPRSSALQSSLNANCPRSSCANMPVEMEADEVLGPSGKGPNSGSDQGYVSKISSQQLPTRKQDPLEDLARLQEELLGNHFEWS